MTEHLTRTPYELAMLAGGPQRVLDVALAMMVRSERLRVSLARELTVISPVANQPVEQAILDTLGPAGRATVHAVRRHAPRHASITELRMRLIAEGLLRATAPSRLGRVLLGRRSGRTTGQGRRVLRQNRAEQILGPGGVELGVAMFGLTMLTPGLVCRLRSLRGLGSAELAAHVPEPATRVPGLATRPGSRSSTGESTVPAREFPVRRASSTSSGRHPV